MDEAEIIHAVASFFGCDDDEAERWLRSQSGCFQRIGGTEVWLSGQMIHELLQEITTS